MRSRGIDDVKAGASSTVESRFVEELVLLNDDDTNVPLVPHLLLIALCRCADVQGHADRSLTHLQSPYALI